MPLTKKAIAEFFPTFWLVFGGCGSALLAVAFPKLGSGFVGAALAFGLTVPTMAYAVGHLRAPSESRGVVWLVGGKRFATADLFAYLIAQVVEGVAVRTCGT